MKVDKSFDEFVKEFNPTVFHPKAEGIYKYVLARVHLSSRYNWDEWHDVNNKYYVRHIWTLMPNGVIENGKKLAEGKGYLITEGFHDHGLEYSIHQELIIKEKEEFNENNS